MEWLETILRFISFWLDKLFYSFVPTIYDLLIDIANTTIFTEEIFDTFASKVYGLLGIFMLFKVSFSILTYIVDPDAFLDKSKGFSKLISNVIITLTLLIATPWLFSQAMEIQQIILRDNILGKIFSTTSVNPNVTANAGNVMAYETFKAFYHFNYDDYSDCKVTGKTQEFNGSGDCQAALGIEDDNQFDNLKNTLNGSFNYPNIDEYMNYDLLYLKDSNDEYVMYYIPIISTLAGVALLLLLVVFCFDVALRSVKLGFLRMIAPVPIISRIDPKKGKETFDKWVKTTIGTYLDLFIRLLAIYFAIFVITQVIDLKFVDATTGLPAEVNVFVKVFIILGALLFAKQLPQLIQDLTGIKMDGKFTLNPLKKLSQVPGIEKIGGTAGGTIAGIKAGSRVGNPLLGAAMGFSSGYKSSSWSGDGKGGFMTGANSAYKRLMGKDFLNFQFKPGGKKAVDEVGDALKNAYGIKTGLEKDLSVASSISNHWAEELATNGVDINGDLNAQSQLASSAIGALNSEMSSIQQQIATAQAEMSRTKSKDKLVQLNKQLQDLESTLSQKKTEIATNHAIVNGIQKYSESTQKELSIRTAIEKVSKDIKDLSTEKSQRENFYGVDPSPAVKVNDAISRANNGTKSYF